MKDNCLVLLVLITVFEISFLLAGAYILNHRLSQLEQRTLECKPCARP